MIEEAPPQNGGAFDLNEKARANAKDYSIQG
jgi:hypothetical protein